MYQSEGGAAPVRTAPKPAPKRKPSSGTHFGASRSSTPSYTPPPRPAIQQTGRIPRGGPGPTSGGGRSPTVSAPARPMPPSVGSFLKRDIGYQQALREYRLNFQNFLGDKARQTTSAQTELKTNQRGMATQRTRDLADMLNDFASRGMLQSGLYAQRRGEYEQDYQRNFGSLQTQYDDFLKQLAQAQQQLSSQQRLGSEQARQEALARRASKYGL